MKTLNKPEINVAVVGCGFGKVHIRTLASGVGHFVLKKVCDLDAERLKIAAELPETQGKKIAFISDIQQVLNDPEIDVVSLALPHHLHKEFALAAAKAGKHIMLDKPLARTVEEGEAIVRAAEAAQVQLMVAFNFRYTPLYRAMHDTIARGALGPVILAATRHYQRFFYPGGSNWRNGASVGGGAIMGSGVHNVDMLRYCLGEPQEVYAAGVYDPQRLDAEAGASVVFRYKNNCLVDFFCNWCLSSEDRIHAASKFGEWEFYGRDGELRLHLDGKLKISRLDHTVEEVEVPEGAPFVKLWEHFESCLRSGELPLTTGADALRTQKLIAAIYRSMQSGKPVEVAE